MKITNRKTTVTLANDFKCGMVDFKKGQVFDARKVKLAGLIVATGCGMDEIIPHDFLGTYEETYNEVTADGEKKKVTVDATEIWLAHWKALAEKEAAENLRLKKTMLKNQVATVRKTIEYVKNGNAEKELANLLAELAKIA